MTFHCPLKLCAAVHISNYGRKITAFTAVNFHVINISSYDMNTLMATLQTFINLLTYNLLKHINSQFVNCFKFKVFFC